MTVIQSKKIIFQLAIVCIVAMMVTWVILKYYPSSLNPHTVINEERNYIIRPVPRISVMRDAGAVGSTQFQESLVKMDAVRPTMLGTVLDDTSNSSDVLREKLWGCYDYRPNRLAASRSAAKQETLERLNCERRAPDAILIGVKKCGTQTLTGFLDLHPDVVSRVYPFDGHKQAVLDGDVAGFIRQVPLSRPSEQTFIDLIDMQSYSKSLANISSSKTGFNGTKFFLLLRDPVIRAQSDYVHVQVKTKHPPDGSGLVKHKKLPVWDKKLRQRREPNVFFKGYRIAGSFEKSVLNSTGAIDVDNELIRKGMYFDYVDDILKYIPLENLFVLDGETFASEPWTVLTEVEEILGVGAFFNRDMFQRKGSFYCPVLKERPDADCLKGKGRKKGQIDNFVKRRLTEFYRQRNSKLPMVLGKAFRWN